ADVAADGDPAPGHVSADPFDATAVALDDDVAVAGITLHGEELAEFDSGVTVLNGQFGDLAHRFAEEVIGRDTLGLDGDGGLTVIAEGKHGASGVRSGSPKRKRGEAVPRLRFGLLSGRLIAQQLVQVQVERPEFAAVIASRDADDARPAGG